VIIIMSTDDVGFLLFAPKGHSEAKQTNTEGCDLSTSPQAFEDERTPSCEKSFRDLGLAPFLVQTVSGLSMRQPTPIQAKCIPRLLAEDLVQRPLLGVAQTGTGKTAAFALPMLHALSQDPFGIFAVVLTPTRELAIQIAEQFKALSKPFPLQLSLIVGGLDMLKQSADLARLPHVVVATPGRLADLLSNRRNGGEEEGGGPSNFLDDLKGRMSAKGKLAYLILDEADRLLGDERSFGADLRAIFVALRGPRTRLAGFTATVNGAVRSFFPHIVDCSESTEVADTRVAEKVDQFFLLVPSQVRDVALVQLLTKDDKLASKHNSMIIFVNKCLTGEILRRTLKLLGVRGICALHSQQTQAARLSALAKFRSHQTRILIATDLAARGLDIPRVNIVLNYDVPSNYRDYVHRVGRTGRAGRLGLALTLIGEMDVVLKENIEQHTGSQMQDYPKAYSERDITDNLVLVNDAKRLASMALREQESAELDRNEKKRRAKLAKRSFRNKRSP
jgi:ATP-dependent RNA helicase DDX49/DBP8